MPHFPEHLRRKIRDEERLGCFLAMQQRLEHEGRIPPGPPLLLRAYERPLQWAGGILVGLIVGSSSVLGNFILFNYIMHLF